MSTLAGPLVTVLLILAGQVPGEDPKPQPAANEVKQLDGLWHGSWGGGDSNGVVFQPVLAEMLISGEKFELIGFPNLDQGWGLIRIDPAAKNFKVTTARTAESPSKVLEYTYKVTGTRLTLLDENKVSLELHKLPLDDTPLVKVRLDLLTADGINEAGNLMVTEYSPFKVGRSKAIQYQAATLARKIDAATIFLTEEAGVKKISLEDARKRLKLSTPVAIAYRETDRHVPALTLGLRQYQGIAQPDSDAGLATLTRSLRLGTLVFVVDTQQAIPEP